MYFLYTEPTNSKQDITVVELAHTCIIFNSKSKTIRV